MSKLIQLGHRTALLVANQLTCRERVQVNSQDSGSVEDGSANVNTVDEQEFISVE